MRRLFSCSLLFDEIEKAHARVLDIFLQILDAARVSMANGETLDLSGFYVVFTSNIGGADLLNLQHSSFATMERHVLAPAQQALRPELFARITEKVVFNRLNYDVQLEIARLLLVDELNFLGDKGHELEPDAGVLPFIVRRGFHAKLGARPMRDTIEKLVGDAVAVDLLTKGMGRGRLSVDEVGNCLVITRRDGTSEGSNSWLAAIAGATSVSEPATKPWKQTVAYLRAKDGHLVELCTPLP